MTKTYHARLRLEASVPEQPELEPFLKASVEFIVYCPKCGPRRNFLKKDGFDDKHSAHPQLFYCKRHHMNFYAHTSWLFRQLSEIVFERIVFDLFERRLDQKAVATIHQISPSLISQIQHYFTQALDWKLAQLAQKRQALQQVTKLPVPLEDAIYWDETFFRIGKVSWALILLVDARGKPLAWKFSRVRTVEVYLELLQTLEAQLPPVLIFVGDGWNAYQKTCSQLTRECFLIEHLHSHPWQYVRLHHFQPDLETSTTLQTSLEIPYNSFVQNQPVTGHALQRKKKTQASTNPSRKRGRPKGVKDKQKRRSRYSPRKKDSKRQLKKRGRKSLRQHGRQFQFHPQPLPVGWNIEWVSPPLTDPGLTCPPKAEIELLLDLTYKVMDGGVIQSNRIESVNRVIKDVTPSRGLKNLPQLQKCLNTHLSYWSNTFDQSTRNEEVGIPLSSSVGFVRLLTFFRPCVNAIQVITTF